MSIFHEVRDTFELYNPEDDEKFKFKYLLTKEDLILIRAKYNL